MYLYCYTCILYDQIQDQIQVRMRNIFYRLHLLSCEEKGAAFSVFKDGKQVVDLWGGYADIQAWQPWKSSTLSNTFSLYDAVATLSLGLLYER